MTTTTFKLERKYMTVAFMDNPLAAFHDDLTTVDFVVQYVVPQGRHLELYEHIDGAYVKVAEYGVADSHGVEDE